jgi:M6 family metalloprotease-like protein
VGWYNLPQPRAAYFFPNGSPNTRQLADDCAAAADPDVMFPQFAGMNFIFNTDVGGSNFGMSDFLGAWDGQSRTYGVSWIGDAGSVEWTTVAHEMGHALGLPHSGGPYGSPYDSRWDVMSRTACEPWTPPYGCAPVHPIAYHKDRLGWIPATAKYVASTPGTHSITLAQLATPAMGSDYLVAQIPVGGSTKQWYTVEARRQVEYDQGIPGNAVVLHQVDTRRDDQTAQVVDADTNGDPNDAGAMWLPGETFRDQAHGITVAVNRATASGFTVTITTTEPMCPDAAYEPDDVFGEQARAFTVGATETHAFCDAFDIDRVYFDATAGTTYRIETRNLAAGTDTILDLVGNGFSRTDDNSNGGRASVITWTAPLVGRVNVGVRQANDAAGATLTYDLRITATPPAPLTTQQWLPLVAR